MSKSDSTKGISLDLEMIECFAAQTAEVKTIKLYTDTDTPPCWCSNSKNDGLGCVRAAKKRTRFSLKVFLCT